MTTISPSLAEHKVASANERTPTTWLFLFGAVVLFSQIDIVALGFDIGADREVYRIVTVALSVPGALLIAFDQQARVAVLRLPMLCLSAALAWTVATSPWGSAPIADLIAAFGLASLATFGAWMVGRVGWEQTLTAIGNGLGIFLAGSLAAPLFADSAMLEGRLRGLAVHPNELGFACVIAIVAALAGIAQRRRSAPILLGLAIIALLATDSRTSIVAAVIVVSVWARPIVGRAVPMLVTAVGLIAIAAVLATGSTTQVSEAASRTGDVEEISSIAGRTEVWDVAVDLTNERPVTGFGSNSSGSAFEGLVSWRADHAHNFFLQMGVHGGWPALLLTIAAFGTYWTFARRNPSADRDAIVVGVLIVGLTEAIIRRPSAPVIVLAAALAAASPGFGRRAGNAPGPSPC